MLKGISPVVGPELLKTLHEMGHGDEFLLADAHFPAHSHNERVLRADGVSITHMLQGVLPLLALDLPGHPLCMMQPDNPAVLDRNLEHDYMRVVLLHEHEAQFPVRIARQDFYNRARGCFAVLVTGDARPYGNIILRKGVTTC